MCKENKNKYVKQQGPNNEKFRTNLYHKKLTDHETTKQLYWQKASDLVQLPQYRLDIKAYLNTSKSLYALNLKYIFSDSPGKPHLLHVKSNQQWPPQPSVALRDFLERTSLRLPPSVLQTKKITFQHSKREVLKTISKNKEKNLIKADKWNTTITRDNGQKIQ